jgi:hypothetical protein
VIAPREGTFRRAAELAVLPLVASAACYVLPVKGHDSPLAALHEEPPVGVALGLAACVPLLVATITVVRAQGARAPGRPAYVVGASAALAVLLLLAGLLLLAVGSEGQRSSGRLMAAAAALALTAAVVLTRSLRRPPSAAWEKWADVVASVGASVGSLTVLVLAATIRRHEHFALGIHVLSLCGGVLAPLAVWTLVRGWRRDR